MVKAETNKETSAMVNKEKAVKSKKVSSSVKEKKEVVKPEKKNTPAKTKSLKVEKPSKPEKVNEETKLKKSETTNKLEKKNKAERPNKPEKTNKLEKNIKLEKNVQQNSIVKIDKPVKIEKAIIIEKENNIIKSESISILKPLVEDAPIYEVDNELSLNAQNKKIDFSKIIPQDDILKSLSLANYKQADLVLQKVLSAALRGSDVFAFLPTSNSTFLIGAIVSIFKILNGSLTRAEAKQPVALILASNEKSLADMYNQTVKVFSKNGVHFALINETMSEDEKKVIFEKHTDVLFSTLTNLDSVKNQLNLNSIGMCVCFEFDNVVQNNSSVFENVFKLFPHERVQKIFLAHENNPKAREVAFNHLDDAEYFYFLPCYVKDRLPKQFAHALTTTQKFQVLLGHLKHHKPMCAMVFANTKTVAEWIAYKLHCNGIKVELVTSHLNFSKKQQLIKQFNTGEINVIVTTDYQSTTLGFENLNCLYQFDLPDTPDKFFARLNLIEKSKSPISISFICEDYGYNMGKIEDKMGFKIHVVHPDKEYFNAKDVSDYPLDVDGRVKRINKTAPVGLQAPVKPQVTQQTVSPIVVAQAQQTASTMQDQVQQTSSTMQAQVQQSQIQQTASTMQAQAPISAKKVELNKFQDKYIRRDDKAKEAIDAAKAAATQKQKIQSDSSKDEKSKNILSVAAFIFQDAIKAATAAAKQSLTTNIEQNLPLFSGFLNKIPFLKQEKSKE